MSLMPMFPLGSVLLPGAVLPLHVFEPRYRALVQHCVAQEEHEFGVTLIERGWEVGGGDQRAMVGTVARMLQVAETEDGRYAVICVGTRRIKVSVWLPDDPYPIAEVEDWPEAEPDIDLRDRIEAVAARVRRAAAMASELGAPGIDAAAEISDDPILASYHLTALSPIGAADAFRLLCAAGPAERLDLLEEALADAEAAMQFRLGGEP
jgi:Lon protease-like protein